MPLAARTTGKDDAPQAADAPRSGATRERGFFGHPSGLAYLAFTEAWERFSFYGMQTLLVLYMTGHLLRAPYASRVVGFGAFQVTLSAVFGHMTTIGLASMIFGLYSALAYFLPVFGGWVGDRLTGQFRAVLAGAVLMALGHLLMVFESAFLFALLLLILGAGLLKGNINTQVGRLYAETDRRRADAYQIFSLGVNAGVVAAPFVCGTLGETLGWAYGFGAAGVGMLIGLAIYVAGRKHLPPDRTAARRERARLQPGDGSVIAALLIALLAVTAYLTCVGQIGGVYILWLKQAVDRRAFGLTIPATWFLSATAIYSLALPPLLLGVWRAQAARGREPGEVAKIAIGCGFGAIACLLLAALAAAARPGQPVTWPWLLAFHLMVSLGYLYAWPVGMALFSRAAPKAVSATFIGVFFLSGFLANLSSGWLGRFYEPLGPARFWLLQAAIGASGVLLLALCGRPLRRILSPHPTKGTLAP